MLIPKFFVVLFFLNLCTFSESETRSLNHKQKPKSSEVETEKTDKEVDDYINFNRSMWRSSRYKESVKIYGRTFDEKEVIASRISGYQVFEGDIILGPTKGRSARLIEGEGRENYDRGALRSVIRSDDNYLWPLGFLIYDISPELQNDQRIVDAMAHWEQKTSIKFLKRTTEVFYVRFQDGLPRGCNSWVGRMIDRPELQPQAINLVPNCTLGNTIHEIGHALGLWHEQSREDRDDYIEIMWENIEEEYRFAFDQHVSDGDDIGPYDFGSIMHYPSKAFSTNGLPTIVSKQPNDVDMGQRLGLSQGDINAIQEVYGPEFEKRPKLEIPTNNKSEAYLAKTRKILKKIAKLYKAKGYQGSAKKKIAKITRRALHFLRIPQEDGSYLWADYIVEQGKKKITDLKSNPYSKQVKVIKNFLVSPSERKLEKILDLNIL